MSRLRESIRQIRDGEKELTEHEIENKQGHHTLPVRCPCC